MQLMLIRHASNDWVGNRLAGWTAGVHLNDEGRAEACRLAARLAGHPLSAVYSSPLERAVETASFVAGPHGLDVQIIEAAGEVRYGEWEGRSLEELRDEPLWGHVQFSPSGTRFPGGETIAEVQWRVVGALESLRRQHEGQSIAVVAHGDVVKVAVAHYVGAHIDLFQRLVVDTASLTVIHFHPNVPRLVLFNDTGSVPPPPKPREAAAHAGANAERPAAEEPSAGAKPPAGGRKSAHAGDAPSGEHSSART